MDYEMESVDGTGKDVTDKSIDMEWQIDSEWINLSSTPTVPPANNRKGKQQVKQDSASFETSPPSFQFISAGKGVRYMLIDNQTLRLSQKKASGYSYWVCSIPCCSARCVLDPEEKKLVRFCRSHNHDADVSRQEYKKFINALKIAVKENPHVKPKALYDAEVEKAKERWRESKVKNNSNEEEPSLPSFDKVRTAMHNSRNAVLSSVSLKATEEDSSAVIPETVQQAGPSRSTRSRDAKANPKRKNTPSKSVVPNGSDLDELGEDDEEDETDNNWRSALISKQPSEDVNFHFIPSNRGSNLMVIDGCALHQNTIHASGKSYWRCQKKGCSYRAVYDPKVEKVTKTTGFHNHPPDSNQMMKRQFISNIKSQMTEHPYIPAKEIYDQEVQKVQQEFTGIGVSWKIPPFSKVKHHVYKVRKTAEDEDEMSEPIKRQITETEKKFLEEPTISCQEEEIGPTLSLLSPKSTAIQSKNFPDCSFYFIPSKMGKRILVVNDFTFRLNNLKAGGRYYWKCTVEPCMFRCVYNENIKDLIKVSGKHTHVTNINKLRSREFCFLLKARVAENPSLTPKKAYDQELARICTSANAEQLMKFIPPYSSVRTSLYNQKHKRAMVEEQGLNPEVTSGNRGNNNYRLGSTYFANSTCLTLLHNNFEQPQDISPKDITQLSLEDNDPMDHDDDDKVYSSSSSSNAMEIAAPSLYDNHDIIDNYNGTSVKGQACVKSEIPEENIEIQVITMPDPSTYSLTFVTTTRGGRALVVNGCVLRISYTRDFVTYWRCLNNDCNFRCSYDSKSKRLLRISGEHNHSVNRYSPIIRTFVRKVKKRVHQESDLSPKIIYDEEVEHLKSDEKDEDLMKKLPSYDSLKSTLYKFRNRSTRAGTSKDDSPDYLSDESDEEKDDEGLLDNAFIEDPPDDPVIEEGFAMLNMHLPSWLDQSPDTRLLDGHILTRRSTSETSSGWACSKDGCPFRCVIDNETNAITRGQWDHTHKSAIKHTISQALIHCVKRRALMDMNLLPKTIYEQERKRIVNKLCNNKSLVKFIPNLSQVYQLITKTRTNPPPPPKQKLHTPKILRRTKTKKTQKSSDSNSSLGNSSGGQFDADFLHDHSYDVSDRVALYVNDHQQQQQISLMYEPGSDILPDPLSVNNSGLLYQPPSVSIIGSTFTNNPSAAGSSHQSVFNSGNQHEAYNNTFTVSCKPASYLTSQACLQTTQPLQPMQQKAAPLSASLPLPQSLSLSPNSENVFTLHGYPLLPATTQQGNVYWQCRVPGCRFQCVLNAGTSQIVQISGNHNHEPPGSQSAFCSQVVKMLQRKAAENLGEPLNNVYWEYMKNLREVLDSEEILSGLPRFQDVALAMQNSRSAMGADDSSIQLRNLVTGVANQTNKVYEYHFDTQNGSLVIDGDQLELSWRTNELSHWRCRRPDCRFKCMLDDELQCVHIMNPHTHSCPSSTQGDDRNGSVKRKFPDKQSSRKQKFQRRDEVTIIPSH
ncbi:uncharacterized protein LOC131927729 [Physella acuta]|uniref:uncharacterized protein LOC131927729 n=1 Tax=Physella acuta TaxID=109671 RepID=UPI0027DAD8D9|nr:uncharacterized protein LOC131927729 [Physella acuta]XP_059139494.1 uncharacterized protein LOC131927729 [Physella acuta]XP_059139495.1 uncharacterized protein LOC131927729 [Physella acuta]XP_059139496.1 uncharacterized protein LOC131927729 [Physella acuta]